MAYEQYAREMAIIFGADETTASNDTKDIVDFEIQIAQVRKNKPCSDLREMRFVDVCEDNLR